MGLLPAVGLVLGPSTRGEARPIRPSLHPLWDRQAIERPDAGGATTAAMSLRLLCCGRARGGVACTSGARVVRSSWPFWRMRIAVDGAVGGEGGALVGEVTWGMMALLVRTLARSLPLLLVHTLVLVVVPMLCVVAAC